MRKAMIMVLAVIGGCLLSGCAVDLAKDGAVGVRTSTTFEFFHSSPDDGSEARIDVLPWVQEEFKANREQAAILEQIKATAEAKAVSDGR